MNFDSENIAREWDKRLYKMQFTAERVALKNIRKGIMPPDCASEANGNIWYDAIGGQMKAECGVVGSRSGEERRGKRTGT